MAEKKTASQTQQNPTFTDGLDRLGATFEQIGEFQAKAFEQLTVAMDEYNRLSKAQLQYANELATAWRTMALDQGKRATDMFSQFSVNR